MPGGRKRQNRTQERHAFGLTMLDTSHPEVRRLRHTGAQPALHGQKIWRTSFVLMDYLYQRGVARRTRVLDVGCGWGLLGIYCAKMFDADVTGLDADAAVFPYLQLHAQLNGVYVRSRHQAFEHLQAEDLADFDLIIGADICFWDELVAPLHRLVQHGIQAGVGEILVADPDRPPFDELCARCIQTCKAEVLDWDISTPVSSSGRILRAVGNGW